MERIEIMSKFGNLQSATAIKKTMEGSQKIIKIIKKQGSISHIQLKREGS
jgi:hypothetical protein